MHDVYYCNTGIEALALLEKHRPSALIVDLMLPAMDGLTVLRRADFQPSIILALTNIITNSLLQAAADVGVQDVILIPCTIQHVVDHLVSLIEGPPLQEYNPQRE